MAPNGIWPRGADFADAIQNQAGYVGIKVLPTLNHRYLFEDVPMTLVVIAALGRRDGLAAQVSIALVAWPVAFIAQVIGGAAAP